MRVAEPGGKGFNLVQWSVDHPQGVLAFFLAMLLLGWIAIGYIMPRRFMPYVESPLLGIVTEAPGLSAEEVETYFSAPIEQRMVNVPNVRYIRSTSQDGFSMVVLEYPFGTDMQKAQTEVQSLLSVVQADLPATGANLKPSWILRVDPLNLPILSLALTGDSDKGWDLARLRDLADNELINRFKSAHKNVYTVATFGGHRRQLQVRVDRDRLRAAGLSVLEVRDAIDRYNAARPAGLLTNEKSEPILRVDSLARGAEDIARVPVKSDGTRIVRVGDIAEVKDTVIEDRSAYHHLHGDQVDRGIVVNVLQNPDASSPVTIDAVMKTAHELEREYPGIHLKVAYDNGGFVQILFGNMQSELIAAILLTGLAVLFFLGEPRATLIALTAIPVSLAMALLAMVPFHLSLNSSTLVGLLIAIGRLVDDAIIDVHAVERHLRMGKDRRTATIDGISEVRRSVLAATIVLIVALIPLMVSGGLTQLMFVGLGLPIIFGLVASYIVSMTLTAVLCSRFMTDPETRPTTWFSRIFLHPFERWLRGLEAGYEHLILWMLRHRFANFVRIGITVILGFTLYYFIGSEMMPLGDVGQASLVMEMQPGTPFKATEGATQKLERILIEEGGRQGWIRDGSLELGVEGGPGMTTGGAYFTGYQANQVSAVSGMITLSDKDTGRPDVWTILDRMHGRAMKEIPGIRRIQLKEMGSDVMATSLAPVSLVLYGRDLAEIDRLGHEVLKIAQTEAVSPKTGKPDIAQPFLSWEMTKPTLTVKVDEAKAAALGLNPAMVAEQAYYGLRGGFGAEYYRLPNRRPTTVQIRFREDQRRAEADLDGLFISAPDGRQIPLGAVASLEHRLAPSAIEHDQLRRAVNFGGYYRKDGRPSMDVMMDVQMRSLAKLNWPAGYGLEARGDMTQMLDSFRLILTGLAIALCLMYLILVAQFGSFLQPLQMVVSLPLELSGVFFMLWLMHLAFSTVSLLGVIVLSGMDVVTAILLIDLILGYRRSGMPRNLAVAKACPQRLRPILMTSLITIFVMAGVAFSPKTGLDAYQPLGAVIIGGLAVGTVLSLLDIPIMHTLVDDLQRWIHVHVLRRDPALLPPVE
ncbi:MAG: efflux RND transporter permease subunit [Fimbriimonas ginsengisoli]|uniref:Efflux RND transporter permease subunit n=1 Tax=Fimbriimonas ginsengisoli TaxID=1005039 RepID=A0A931LX39_FIMGI|nr:efflux RND transporter permease subunit [Fimbriimonas ginsengisoli]